jgi:hypothetical protein
MDPADVPLMPPALQRVLRPPTAIDIGWTGDASSTFGIGVVIGTDWAAWRWRGGTTLETLGKGIAWAEAAAVLLGHRLAESLGLLEPYRANSTPIFVLSDNTVVECGIGRGRSRDASVNDVLSNIYDAGAEIGIELAPERISSEANQAADAAS